MGEHPGARAALTSLVAVLGGVVVVVLLVTWAASIGPSGVVRGDGPVAERIPSTSTPTSPSDTPATEGADDRQRLAERFEGRWPWLRVVAWVLEGLLALAVLWLLVRGARRAWEAWDARRRPPPEAPDLEFDVLADPPRAVGDEVARDADRQRALLLEGGSPRNAIVACWHRFEEQAAAAGLARHPWETSSEFTLRMLDLLDADTAAVARLAALYREARFSGHDLDEDARASALAALDTIHQQVLRRRSGRVR